ncbi:Uncharacterised protein [Vibrio cholerae]|nr:Uncharacterised protein [Vibrio cholerae]
MHTVSASSVQSLSDRESADAWSLHPDPKRTEQTPPIHGKQPEQYGYHQRAS